MLALGFLAEWDQCQPNKENEGRHCDGNSNRLKVADAHADQKRESRGCKATEVGDKCEGARAAFGSVLFGQPEGIHDEICSAQT